MDIPDTPRSQIWHAPLSIDPPYGGASRAQAAGPQVRTRSRRSHSPRARPAFFLLGARAEALLSRLDPKFYDPRLSGFYVEAKGQ